MALKNRLLSPKLSLSLFARLLKARCRIGSVCLASPALLYGGLLLPAAASPLQRPSEPAVKQSESVNTPETASDRPSEPTANSVLDGLLWGTPLPAEPLPVDAAGEEAVTELPGAVRPADVRPVDGEVTNTGWSMFTSEAGKFRVSMPSAPAAYTFLPDADLIDGQVFGSRMYMQMHLVDANHLEIYAAAYIASARFTDEVSHDVTAALLGCVTGLSDHAPVMPPEAIALGEYPGIEAEFLTEEGALQVSRCYLAGDRAYLLTATNELFSAGAGLQPVSWGSSVPVRSSAMDTFFNSFEILP